MELLDVIDEYNNLTGKVEDKDIIHKNGIYHREIAIWIMNEKGEVLLQKRASTKKQNPNKWGLTAGHIDAGETVENAMRRETLEEIGININNFKNIFVEKSNGLHPNCNEKNNCYVYHFFTKVNYKLNDYKIQEEELSQLKYITLEELEEIVKNKDENYTFSKRSYMKDILKYLYEERRNLNA